MTILEQIQQRQPYKFESLKLAIQRVKNRAPLTDQAYYRSYHSARPVSEDFTLEEIYTIIRSGNLESARELSRYFYRTNGEYRNNIDFLASLPLYDTVVIPVSTMEKGSEAQILKAFDNACKFIENC